MVNMIAHHSRIHDPPPLRWLDLLARANLDRGFDRQSFLCSVHEYPNDAVSDLQDSRGIPGFSALITGIAIVHTTGMPVVYSSEIRPDTPHARS
jgi:hypothetical protein